MKTIKTDVVIIGGGVGGCIAALLYAKEDLNVVVLERTGLDDYKVNCTHYIQPVATKVFKRLELEERLVAAGGLKNSVDIWTPSGWIDYEFAYGEEEAMPYGYNIKRKDLDPFLKNTLLKEEKIDLKYSCSMKSIIYDENNEAVGVKALDRKSKEAFEVHAKLVVAADGRFSRIAKMTDNPAVEKPNERFSCTAYYKNVELTSGEKSQVWMMDLGQAHAFKLNKDTTLLNVFLHDEVANEWRNAEDLDDKLLGLFSGLADAPNLENQERVTDFIWMFNMTNMYRSPAKKRVAFVGDAAMAIDPMTGVGCAFAIGSAELLVDATSEALKAGNGLPEALEAYCKKHVKTFKPHADSIATNSVKNKGWADKSFYDLVVKDPKMCKHYLDLIGRLVNPTEFQTLFLKRMMSNKKSAKLATAANN